MDMGSWLERSAIHVRGVADTKRQALSLAADLAAKAFGLKASEVLEALLEREAAGSTGVGYGVAVPHAKLPALDRMRAVFVKLDHPVAFDSLDDKPVDLVFALFAPVGAETEHLRSLARLSRLLRKPEIREQLRNAHSVDAVYAILVREVESSAA